MDGNHPPDCSSLPLSCHHTFEAAARAAERGNAADPNGHEYVVEWSASRWARLPPNDAHYPADAWIRRVRASQEEGKA